MAKWIEAKTRSRTGNRFASKAFVNLDAVECVRPRQFDESRYLEEPGATIYIAGNELDLDMSYAEFVGLLTGTPVEANPKAKKAKAA